MTVEKGTTNREYCLYASCIYPWSDLRGVTLRNIFNPIRGPSMSPAPNSTSREKHRGRLMLKHARVKKQHKQTNKKNHNKTPTPPNALVCIFTSPQPLADVTLRIVMLMLPPPFPLCVDSEPDSTAVSEFVKGA